MLFLGLRFELLLVPLVVRRRRRLRRRLVCCLGKGALLLEWESRLQNQLGGLVTVEEPGPLRNEAEHGVNAGLGPLRSALLAYLEELPLLPLLPLRATLSHHRRRGLAVGLSLRRLGRLQSQSLSLPPLLDPGGSQNSSGSETRCSERGSRPRLAESSLRSRTAAKAFL